MKVIYIAGAYRADSESGVFENIMRARSVALRLWGEGWAVICPHTNSIFMGSRLGGDEKFIEGDLAILSRCDAIYMLNNWENSRGAKLEYQEAKRLGLDVYKEFGL